MTMDLRVESITLVTDFGETRHNFVGPLTVLSGPIGVGKTTLFESLKFVLGSSARLSPVITRNVRQIAVELVVAGNRMELTRMVGPKSREVLCSSADTAVSGVYPVARTKERASIGDLVMNLMGLPPEPTYTTKTRTSRISFSNIWWFVYVEQREVDRSIAHSGETYADPARRATFDLLLGLSSTEAMEIRARAQRLADARKTAAMRVEAVRQFLVESRSQSRLEAESALDSALRARNTASTTVISIQSDAHAASEGTHLLRDMVLANRREVSALEESVVRITKEMRDRDFTLRRLRDRRNSIERASSASDLLAPISFVVCPRCAQDLKKRHIPAGHCTVCTQPDPSPTPMLTLRAESEVSSAEAQERELEVLIVDAEADVAATSKALEASRRNLIKLEHLLDERTAAFVAPRLEAFGDASAVLARSEAEIVALERVLQQWDVVADLELSSEELAGRIDADAVRLEEIEQSLAMRRGELLEELNEEYRRLITRFGIPGITSAYIDPKSYLPYCNGVRWDHLSTGGIATALACAYMVALMSVALRRGDTYYPGLLILDTPRKSIGAQNAEIIEGLYRELDSLALAYPRRLQVIVADNDIPTTISGEWHVEIFDYERPAVRSVPHPGEAHVSVLEADVPADWELVTVPNG